MKATQLVTSHCKMTCQKPTLISKVVKVIHKYKEEFKKIVEPMIQEYYEHGETQEVILFVQIFGQRKTF